MLPVCSVFAQSPHDDIVVCLRGPTHAILPSRILDLLPKTEVDYRFLNGEMTQGDVRLEWPEPTLQETNPKRFIQRRNDASFVRASWALSHFFLSSGGEANNNVYGADRNKAVRLVKRMSETLFLIAEELEEKALALGEEDEALCIAPLDTQANAQVLSNSNSSTVEQNTAFSFVSKLPSCYYPSPLDKKEQKEREEDGAKNTQQQNILLGKTLEHVFSYQLVPSTRFLMNTTEVAIVPHHSGSTQHQQPKPYYEMSDAEKERSGSISMKEIMDDLLQAVAIIETADTDSTRKVQSFARRAILNSLKASRGLAVIAKRLEEAATAAAFF